MPRYDFLTSSVPEDESKDTHCECGAELLDDETCPACELIEEERWEEEHDYDQ